jgi:putative transposase
MAYYRKGSHTKYDIKIHLVFVTKYRKAILKGDLAKRVRQLIREICLANEVQIIKGHISQDHIHLLLSYPPRLSVAKLAQYIKGKTSRKLLQEYTEIRKKFWGSHVWARGYFAVSTGNVTDELIAEYIDKQDIEQKDDDFKISDEL